jgi:putative membrane protein
MIGFTNFIIALVALAHIGFMLLEMFLWTKPLGLKIFHNDTPEKEAKARDCAVLAANQGLYNGFLAAGLIWGLWFQPVAAFAFQIKVFFLICVIVAGVYGAATVPGKTPTGPNLGILLLQAVPAATALALLLLV